MNACSERHTMSILLLRRTGCTAHDYKTVIYIKRERPERQKQGEGRKVKKSGLGQEHIGNEGHGPRHILSSESESNSHARPATARTPATKATMPPLVTSKGNAPDVEVEEDEPSELADVVVAVVTPEGATLRDVAVRVVLMPLEVTVPVSPVSVDSSTDEVDVSVASLIEKNR